MQVSSNQPRQGPEGNEALSTPRHSAKQAVIACALAAILGMAVTWPPIFDRKVEALYRTNPDIRDSWRLAEQVRPIDVARWFYGNWLERTHPYYRPLSSVFRYGEYLLFRRAHRSYCIVSWIIQGGICALMMLLLARLNSGRGWRRFAPGLLAVAWFAIPCETAADGPHWGNRGLARGVMPYWPIQVDLLCLATTLGALIAFDGYFISGRRRRLGAGLMLFVMALLFKETAVIFPGLLLLLALTRRQPWRRTAGVTCISLGIALVFLELRHLFVPNAMGPVSHRLGYLASKLLFYTCEPARTAIRFNEYWILVSAATLVAALWAAGHYERWALPLLLAGVAGIFVPPVLWGKPFLLATVAPEGIMLIRVALTLAVGVLAWRYRRKGGTLFLAGGVLVVQLPVLHVTGPHYFYWPVCWWSMLDAMVVWLVIEELTSIPVRRREAASRLAC